MPLRAVQQQDAADEVRAFTMAALAADLGVRRTSVVRRAMTKPSWSLRRVVRVVILGLLALVGLAALEGAADWAWSIPMRPRLSHLYSFKSMLRPGMRRSEVEAALAKAARSWFQPQRLDTGETSVYVHYSLFEGCYLTLTFTGDTLTGAHTGRS